MEHRHGAERALLVALKPQLDAGAATAVPTRGDRHRVTHDVEAHGAGYEVLFDHTGLRGRRGRCSRCGRRGRRGRWDSHHSVTRKVVWPRAKRSAHAVKRSHAPSVWYTDAVLFARRPATSRVISRGALAPPMVGLATRLSLLLRPRQFCPSVTALFWCADFCGFGLCLLRRCQRTCEAPLLLSCRAAWLRSKLAHRRVSVQWLGALLPIAHVLAVARDHRRGLMPLVAMTFQSTLGCGGRSASLSRGGLAARAWP